MICWMNTEMRVCIFLLKIRYDKDKTIKRK